MTKNLMTLTVTAIMALSLSTGVALADNSKRGIGNGKGQGAATAAENASDKARGGFGLDDNEDGGGDPCVECGPDGPMVVG